MLNFAVNAVNEVNLERELENEEYEEYKECSSCGGTGCIDEGDPENGVTALCPRCYGEGEILIEPQ